MRSIGDIAKRTNTTVRTLRYYDEIDLLKPTKVDARGRRFYNHEAIAKLEIILMLKNIGFDLQTIKGLVTYQIKSLKDLLQMQLDMIHVEKEKLEQSEKAIKAIIQVIELEGTDNWERISNIFLQLRDSQLVKESRNQYFSKEEQKVLDELPRVGREEDSELVQDWASLLEDIRKILHKGPKSEATKELLVRWSELVRKMFKGNAKLAQKSWEIMRENKEANLGFYHFDQDIIDFMNEAYAYHFPEYWNGESNE